MSIDRQKVAEAAQKLAAKGQFDKAIAEYRRVLQEDPTDVRVLLKIGDLQVNKGATEEAIGTYSQVATGYAQQGFYLKAVAVYKRILQIDPGRVALHGLVAELYVKLGLIPDALQHLDMLAQWYTRGNQTAPLVEVFRQMVRLDPSSVATHIRFAELLSKLQRNDEAAAEFAAGCDLLRQSGRVDDWARVAERLLFHRPSDAGLAKDLANYYLERDDPKRALPKLQVCFKANPRDVRTLELLAGAFRSLGQLPKTLSVLKEVARIHGDAGRTGECNEAWQRVLELAPTDAEARDALKTGARRPPSQPPPGNNAANVPSVPTPEPVTVPPAAASVAPAQRVEIHARASEQVAITDADDDVMIVEDEEEVVFDLHPSVPTAPPDGDEDVAPFVAPPPPAMPGPIMPLVRSSATPQPMMSGPAAQVQRLMGEAEIFLKYGLKTKAVAHLARAADLDPYNAEVHVRLRDLYASIHDTMGVVRASMALARLWSETDTPAAYEEAARALEYDPDNVEARALYDRLGGVMSAPEPIEPDEPIIDENAVMVDEPASHHPESVVVAPDLYDDQTSREYIPVEVMRGLYTDPYAQPQGYDNHGAQEDYAPEDYGREDLSALDAHGHPRAGAGEHAGGNTAQTNLAAMGREIEAGLDEAEFFVTQGLYDEARDTLQGLLAVHPGHPLVLERWEEIESLLQVQAGSANDHETVLLAEKLAEEVDGLGGLEAPQDASLGMDQAFAVTGENPRAISVEDCDTHYDLGIAYKEMGLYDDAIAEFGIATLNPLRQCIGETMIGLCCEEKGDVATAIEHFKRGLQAAHRTEREELGLYFEIGAAYERLGDLSEALYFFQKVDKRDPTFRGVRQRVQMIQVHVDGGALSGRAPTAPGIEEVDRAFDELLKE